MTETDRHRQTQTDGHRHTDTDRQTERKKKDTVLYCTVLYCTVLYSPFEIPGSGSGWVRGTGLVRVSTQFGPTLLTVNLLLSTSLSVVVDSDTKISILR